MCEKLEAAWACVRAGLSRHLADAPYRTGVTFTRLFGRLLADLDRPTGLPRPHAPRGYVFSGLRGPARPASARLGSGRSRGLTGPRGPGRPVPPAGAGPPGR